MQGQLTGGDAAAGLGQGDLGQRVACGRGAGGGTCVGIQADAGRLGARVGKGDAGGELGQGVVGADHQGHGSTSGVRLSAATARWLCA